MNWFRSFIKDLAVKSSHLTNSLRVRNEKEWRWTEMMDKEFIAIKEEIRQINKLKLIDYNKPIVLRTDASNIGLGAVLLVKGIDGKIEPIEWASKKLSPTESRYGITEKEMLGVVWGMGRFSYKL